MLYTTTTTSESVTALIERSLERASYIEAIVTFTKYTQHDNFNQSIHLQDYLNESVVPYNVISARQINTSYIAINT